MKDLIVGINSGTSFDGIDVALIEVDYNAPSLQDLKLKFIDGLSIKYPDFIKKKLEKIIVKNQYSLSEICQLNFLLGEVFAGSVLKIIKKNKLQSKDILLIGSHGQTIFHIPKFEKIGKYKIRSTFQIGENSVIKERTGIKTISNFREADIAAGGSGAPLMPFLDYVFFNKSKNIKALLNIGGISNITIVGKNITPIAFDMGPGNALIDLICKKYFNVDFDKNGKIAKRGIVDFTSVKLALKDNYFKIKPPKSTGREYFNEDFIKRYFSKINKKEDLISTLTFFTASSICESFNDFIFPKYKINELIISGGGFKNIVLMKHLRDLLPELKITSSDEYNLPTQFKEPILFALLGFTSHLGIKNNLPSCTGAKNRVILGKSI